jgi:hypothetical protein
MVHPNIGYPIGPNALEYEIDRLRAKLDEAIALLRDASDVINLSWHDRRRAFLKEK